MTRRGFFQAIASLVALPVVAKLVPEAKTKPKFETTRMPLVDDDPYAILRGHQVEMAECMLKIRNQDSARLFGEGFQMAKRPTVFKT